MSYADGICPSCGALPCDQTDPPTNRTASSDLVALLDWLRSTDNGMSPTCGDREICSNAIDTIIALEVDKARLQEIVDSTATRTSLIGRTLAKVEALEADKAALVEAGWQAIHALRDGGRSLETKLSLEIEATLAKHGGDK